MRCIAVTGIAAIVSLLALATPVQAGIEYPWCAQYGGGDNGGGRNCGFSTLGSVARRLAASVAPASRTCSTQGRPATTHHRASVNLSTSAAQDMWRQHTASVGTPLARMLPRVVEAGASSIGTRLRQLESDF